jgi:hypothetical protein
MTPGLTREQTTSYYHGAFACLQYVDARRPTRRRFGPDADARWKAFKGHLSASERIDLLLRDANAEWPGAFGAREVFARDGIAEDEAFGADWQSLDAVEGEALWRGLSGRPGADAPRDALAAVGRAWSLNLGELKLPAIDAAEQLVVTGPSAVASLAHAFLGRSDLNWAAQVTCIATLPSHRHVALAASAVVDSHRPARVLTAAAVGSIPAAARIIRSDDALAQDIEALQGRV